MVFTTPPSLGDDQALAIVAPSRPADAATLRIGRDRLAALGVETRVYPTADPDRDEPASPGARAADIEDAFADPEVGAVMAYTGGDDQIRVLRHLDGDALAANPTRFFGYSDNDNLRLFLWNRGIVSYGLGVHPDLVCDAELHPYTERYLRRALFEDSLGAVDPADEWTDEWFDFETGEPREWRENPGPTTWVGPDADPEEAVRGRTWGGSFAIVKWHLQTDRFLPDPERLDGAVLALETSEDAPPPREVGYTLCAMGERGLLERFGGVVFGRPRTNAPPLEWDPDPEEYPADIRRVATRELERYAPGVVAGFGYDFGHTDPSFPLPLGAVATLDPTGGTLRFGPE
ncbi:MULTISPECIES: S66 peptidase family protein [unclassified Halorubrum]|uniref:S66 family peptidase n=1 Tax=unclassified Halorubrum TaxID=2642239 RepID=UPI0010F8474D|nr:MULTISPECIES: S66 peptidase family protein [unclassified Halorubrum]TKX45032.1 LD-carboxypeptidase [Halorubrum sp. ARQ200]TKX48822.1 LD-carboxypeptidase [Halorubrum sp. ASP121]